MNTEIGNIEKMVIESQQRKKLKESAGVNKQTPKEKEKIDELLEELEYMVNEMINSLYGK